MWLIRLKWLEIPLPSFHLLLKALLDETPARRAITLSPRVPESSLMRRLTDTSRKRRSRPYAFLRIRFTKGTNQKKQLAAAIVLEGTGNIWLVDYRDDSLIELLGSSSVSPGKPLFGSSAFTGGAKAGLIGHWIAIDRSDNA